MTERYSTRFDAAVQLALDGFRGIARKGSDVPYVTHLFAVTGLVGEHGGDEDQLCAAILHDYVEDVDPDALPMLAERFGPRVAQLVEALTDAFVWPKPPWQERKDAYLAHLREADPEVRLIAAADKLHNARSLREDLATHGLAVFDRFNGGRDGTLWFQGAVVAALRDGWSHRLVDLLAAEVAATEAEVAAAEEREKGA